MFNKTRIALAVVAMMFAVHITHAAGPLKLITTVPPGGGMDLMARSLSKLLTDNDIPNVVVPTVGAGGDIAFNAMLADPDNAVYVLGAGNILYNTLVSPDPYYYTSKITLIGPVVNVTQAFLASERGAISIEALIAQANVDTVLCGASNPVGIQELTRINKEYGTKFEPVAYKGTGPLRTDLLGGHITCAYDTLATYLPAANGIRVLGLGTSINADYPLISKALKDYTFSNWWGLGLSNNSKLLADKKLMGILSSLGEHKDELKGVLIPGIVLAPTFSKIQKGH